MAKIPLKDIVTAVSYEKGVSEDVVFSALELALASATKKKQGRDIDIRVSIDRKSGDYETFRVWEVIDDGETDILDFPLKQITLSAARIDEPEINPGDKVEEAIESVELIGEFSRIAVQTAKQVISQKVREAEREKLAAHYEQHLNKILLGIVKKSTAHSVIVDLGNNAEAILRREELLPKEGFRPGDKIRAVLKEIRKESKGPQLVLSRVAPEMLIELFKIEVPEVSEGVIEIKAASRDPGVRAKIAVKTNDGRIDPVGACVGIRGARVQAVSNELAGERVDIILWDDDVAQFVINAMAPAEIVSIVIDDDKHSIDVAVSEENLSQAIGKGGQNVNLASNLTGWDINIMSSEQASAKSEEESTKVINRFIENLNVEEEVAEVLVDEGFSKIEEIAYVPLEQLVDIEGFDEQIAELLQSRARDYLAEIEKEKQQQYKNELSEVVPDASMVDKLLENSIKTKDDLAELSIDELLAIVDISESQAGDIIMKAREHWFE